MNDSASRKQIEELVKKRRAELVAGFVDRAHKSSRVPARSEEFFHELEYLEKLEAALVATSNNTRSHWRWWFLALGLTSLLMIILVSIRLPAGTMSLDCLNQSFRIIGKLPEPIGLDNLTLSQFEIRQVDGVVAVRNHLDEPVALPLHERLYFSQGARLASIKLDGEGEIVFQRLDDRQFVMELTGSKPEASITLNGSKACVDPPGSPCEEGKASVRLSRWNIKASGNKALQIYFGVKEGLQDIPKELSLIRLSGTYSMIAFDTMRGNRGLPTAWESHLDEASLKFLSYGDAARDLRFGQDLRLISPEGYLTAGWTPDAFLVKFSGAADDVRSIGRKSYTPSALVWLWQNKTLALYFGAFGGIFGFLIEGIRRLQAK